MASANALAGVGLKTPTGAPGDAVAIGAGNAVLYRQVAADGSATASAFGAATAGFMLPLGASTTAAASGTVTALDLALQAQAPEERRMTVPFEERRMEVTQ